MQTRNKILDDISQLMTNAMGVAQGAKDEAETAMKSMIDRWLADRDFVTREEFDAVRAMAQKAREENAARLARIEARRGELRAVWRVREVLGLETQALTLAVGDAVAADQLAGQEIAGVKLQPRLGGQQLHRAAGGWIGHPRGEGRRVGPPLVADEIVVIAAADADLGVVRVPDPVADASRGSEVEGCVVHGADFARGNQALIHGRISRGGEGQMVIHHVAPAVRPGQVEIAVGRQRHHGGCIGDRF